MAYSAQPQINSHKEDYLPFDFVTSPYAYGASYNSFGFKYTSNFMLGFDGQRKFLTPRPGLTTDNTFLSAFPDRVEYCGQYFLYVLLGGNSFLFFYTLAPAGGATYNLYRWDGTTHTLTMSNVGDRKSTRLNSSHSAKSRMPSSA